MKKIYKAPTIKCLELHVTNMIALSLNDGPINSDNASDFEQNVRGNKGWDLWGDDNDFDN